MLSTHLDLSSYWTLTHSLTHSIILFVPQRTPEAIQKCSQPILTFRRCYCSSLLFPTHLVSFFIHTPLPCHSQSAPFFSTKVPNLNLKEKMPVGNFLGEGLSSWASMIAQLISKNYIWQRDCWPEVVQSFFQTDVFYSIVPFCDVS